MAVYWYNPDNVSPVEKTFMISVMSITMHA